MPDYVETAVPGRPAIELVAYYEEFRDFYPQCELETGALVRRKRATGLVDSRYQRQRFFFFFFFFFFFRQNLQHHNIDNAEVHEIALGATTGSREDRIYRLWGTEGEVKTYPFFRLDDFLEQRRPDRIDCLKIDVDSFDFEVLHGQDPC